MDKNVFGDMKTAISDFETARRGLKEGADVFANMAKLKSSVDRMDPLLKSQQVFIKKFFSSGQVKSESEKASEFKRQFSRLCEVVKSQFFQIVQLAQNFFVLNKRQRKESWVKICKQFESQLNVLRDKVDTNNIVDYLFFIMNARDSIIRQLLCSFLYRKEMLWMDLGIQSKMYVHSESKKLMESIKSQQEENGYASTLLEFAAPKLNDEGQWVNSSNKKMTTLPSLFQILNQSFNQLTDIVSNYAKLKDTPESFQDINKNQKIVEGLRQKVQVLQENYAILLQRYREANSKNDDKDDMATLRNKIDHYETLLFQKDNQINEMKQQFTGSSTIIQSLRQKNKLLDAELTRINNYEVTKLRELELIQNTLNDQFSKIKKEIGNYSLLYKLQNESKKEIAKEIGSKQTVVEQLVDILNRERKKIRRLEAEIERLNVLIIQLGGKLP